MTHETEESRAASFSEASSPASALSPPIRALTARFEIDAGSDAAAIGHLPGRAGPSPALARSVSRQGFRIGDLHLMISYEDASELSEMAAMHRLPNAPDWFCGMANLQGKLTPVFDLARYVGVEPDRTAKRMLLVLAHGPDAAGVMVDGLPERLRLPDSDHHDEGAAPERLAPHVRGASTINGQLWFELDAGSLLDAIEHALGATQ